MTDSDRIHRLARERSPYLLQHARNPVDWYPWGDEAFERAAREDRPVFLSIGYSACHWCHVMERESFEDEATARLLNAHYVCIKVDREERPDVDQIYQLAHQMLSRRSGGWPLSMFLLPDRRPFFGGTYFPDRPRYGMPSFRDVLNGLEEAWRTKRDEVTRQAGELARVLVAATSTSATSTSATSTSATPTRDTLQPGALDDAVRTLLARADRTHGGFGSAPKFPSTMSLDLLFASDDPDARAHGLTTLDRMARGGMHDHLGGGFARYSTDATWLVPHFEKMLYDNAQLARLYVDGWRIAKDASLASVTRDTLEYLLREMTDPATGLFYSAQDADSEGEEGRFFVWTPATVAAAAGADAAAACAWFAITPAGNFEHGHTVLSTPRDRDTVARELGLARDAFDAAIERARLAMYTARETRPKPVRDDKCLASWNALALGALADAGATLGEDAWVAAAMRALDGWRARAWAHGRLAHAVKAGEAYGTGYLDDHAGLACAAIDVWEARFRCDDLAFARALLDTMLDQFEDRDAGDFFYTPRDAEVVLSRPKALQDHAYPGGAGLAADALLRMATLTGVARYRDAAERLLGTLRDVARRSPMGVASVVRAIDRAARGATDVVIVGDAGADDTRALLLAARRTYLAHRTLVCVRDEADANEQGLDPALVRGRIRRDGRATAYVCRGTVCSEPVTDGATLTRTLATA